MPKCEFLNNFTKLKIIISAFFSEWLKTDHVYSVLKQRQIFIIMIMLLMSESEGPIEDNGRYVALEKESAGLIAAPSLIECAQVSCVCVFVSAHA